MIEIIIGSLIITIMLCVYTIFILLKDIRGMEKVIMEQRHVYENAITKMQYNSVLREKREK